MHVDLCVRVCTEEKRGKSKGGEVWSFVFSSGPCLRLVVYSLQLSQQANYVEKLLQ